MASLEGDNLVVLYYLCASAICTDKRVAFGWRGLIRGVAFGWRGLIRGVASLEGDNLVVLYYLCASAICTDKRGGLWLEGPYKRGGFS